MPAMSSDAPAGYFSTFSILDPNNTAAGQVRTQKRNRRVFVCIPCHKRKLKCDKNLPCSRCVASGAPGDCVYQAFPSASKSKSGSQSRERTKTPPTVLPRDPGRASYRHSDGRANISGSTHWSAVARDFEEAVPYLYGRVPQWEPRYRQIKNLNCLFPALHGVNFPFSSMHPAAAKTLRVVDSLPPRHVVERLVGSYLDTFETTHRLLHPGQFRDELDSFWEDPERRSDDWQAQLCMMLSLACSAAPDLMLEGTGRTGAAWSDVLLGAAELSFARSPYMAAPSLTTIRTLCMMVLARLTEMRASDPEQLVFFMSFVARVATSLQLHRASTLFRGMPEFEAEMRNRIWVTVQLLDLDVAMRSGTSYLCLEQDALAPVRANESDFHRIQGGGGGGEWVLDSTAVQQPPLPPPPPSSSRSPSSTRGGGGGGGWTDGTFQAQTADMLPLLSETINAVNSPTQPPHEYDQVQSWDARLRQKLREAEAALLTHNHFGSAKTMHKAFLQYNFLEVVVHRTLLGLHHAYANIPMTTRYEQSRIAVMESSLAILDVQHTWSTPASSSRCPSQAGGGSGGGDDSSPGGGSPATAAGFLAYDSTGAAAAPTWLIDICHDDFSIAIIYGLVAFRRHDWEESGTDELPPATMACQALQQAVLFLRDRACRSLSHFKEFWGICILMTCMRAVRNGEPMLPKLLQTADDVEQLVIAAKQDILAPWTAGTMDFTPPTTDNPHHHQHHHPHHPHAARVVPTSTSSMDETFMALELDPGAFKYMGT